MSSNSSLQVSHPLEKPSAACPADFRRGWRETFKVIPHRPLNKPFICPASQCSRLCTVPLHPSMDTESKASSGEEEGVWISGCLQHSTTLLLFLFQQIVAGNYSSINVVISHSVVVGKRAVNLVTLPHCNSSNNFKHTHTCSSVCLCM